MDDKNALELLNSNRCYSLVIKNNTELALYLKNRYNDIPKDQFTYKEVYWRLQKNIESRPVCRVCGKPVAFLGSEYSDSIGKTINGYRKTCSHECQYKDKERSAKFSNTINKSDEEKAKSKEKREQTCLERFGERNVFIAKKDEINSKIKEKYGSHKELMAKARKSFQDANNIDNPFQLETIKEKSKQTCLERYGSEYYSQTEKARKNLSKKLSSPEVKNKKKETCIEKYGVENPLLNKEIQAHARETKLLNNTYRTSEQEQLLKQLLEEIYPDIISQYFNETEYPYLCDFYIPSKKLYIEYNGALTHGYRPFDINSEQDVKERDNRLASGKNIKQWCEIDVEKLNCAKENNLNYLVLYLKWHEHWKLYTLTKYPEKYSEELKASLKQIIENTFGINIVGASNDYEY